eukprot:TRINITY_DN3226_c0_g1_i5.p1 TRINITY_DN3226_c0_g1~~TRINITY_DN3226_c0_g1_i5.p1  ORF type:complete len:431 (-),score=98.44 TRINITY_DN3226_c0_g1_i5:838-2130(-)
MKAALCLAGTYVFVALSLFLVYTSLLEWKFRVSVVVLSASGLVQPADMPRVNFHAEYFPDATEDHVRIQYPYELENSSKRIDGSLVVSARFDPNAWVEYMVLDIGDARQQQPRNLSFSSPAAASTTVTFDCSFAIWRVRLLGSTLNEQGRDQQELAYFNLTGRVHQVVSDEGRNRTVTVRPSPILIGDEVVTANNVTVHYGLKFAPVLASSGVDLDWSSGSLITLGVIAKFVLVLVIAFLDLREMPLVNLFSIKALLIFVQNSIWMMIGGLEFASLYLVVMMLCCFSVFALPMADKLLGIMSFLVLPFGRKLINIPDSEVFLDPHLLSTKALVLSWKLFGAFPLALLHFAFCIVFTVLIFLFPLGKQHLKIGISLFSLLNLDVEFDEDYQNVKLEHWRDERRPLLFDDSFGSSIGSSRFDDISDVDEAAG